MTSEKSTRDTGLDLLRIFLAILVVTIHINAGGTGKVLSAVNATPFTQIVGETVRKLGTEIPPHN